MIKMVLTGLEQLNIEALTPEDQKPGPDEVVMDVVCCAVCRTDAKMWEQGHRDLVMPRVLGHEMVVTDGNGSRFAVWPGKSCKECRYCLSRRENLCREMKITGFHTDGGFAHQVVLPRNSLIPLSKEMDSIAACFAEPVGCVINAFEKIPEKTGERVLVYGGGTMGLITALYAKSIGYHPVVIETHEEKISRVGPFLDAAGIFCTRKTRDGEFYLVINACADFTAFCQALAKVDKAVPFIQGHEKALKLLVEDILPPESAPDLMEKVLTGKPLKYILDFSRPRDQDRPNLTCPGAPV